MEHSDFVTVIKASRPCNKVIDRDNQGQLTKHLASPIAEAEGQTYHVRNLSELQEIILQVSEDTNQCLMLGFVHGSEPKAGQVRGEPFLFVTQETLRKFTREKRMPMPENDTCNHDGFLIAARTKAAVRPSSFVLFDKDNPSGMPESLQTDSQAEWIDWMSQLIPGFDSCEKLIVPSTTSRILASSGELAFKSGGWHTYVKIKDPGDLERFAKDALITAMASQFGFIRQILGSTIAKPAYRRGTIFDPSVFSRERLIFAGKPYLAPDLGDLRIAAPSLTLVSGQILDTAKLAITQETIDAANKKMGGILRLHTPGGSLSSTCFRDDFTLKHDICLEGRNGDTSLVEFFMSNAEKSRIQTPFRESTSEAAFIGRLGNGLPFIYDAGTCTSYYLSGQETQLFIERTISKLTPKTSSEIIERVCGSLAQCSQVFIEKALSTIKSQTGLGLTALRSTMASARKTANGSNVNDDGDRLARKVLDEEFQGGAHLLLGKDGRFWQYVGTHWQPMSDERLANMLYQKLADMPTDATASSVLRQALELVKAITATEDDPFDASNKPKPAINVMNGELWLDKYGNAELRPHNPDSRLTSVIDCEYDPGAKAPRFLSALEEIFSKNDEPSEMIRHILELIGYMAQPLRVYPIIAIFHGEGNDGKSRCMYIVEKLVGSDQIYSADVHSLRTDPISTGNFYGKFVFVDDDLKTGMRLDDGLLKRISESKSMTGAFKFKPIFSFMNRAVPVLLTNSYPLLADISYGMQRRLTTVPFKRKFSPDEVIHDLFEQLWDHEKNGILGLALAGIQRLFTRNRFDPPAECLDAKKRLIAASNPVPQFLEDHPDWFEELERGRNFVTLEEMKQKFISWCFSNGVNYRITSANLRLNLGYFGIQSFQHSGQWVLCLDQQEDAA